MNRHTPILLLALLCAITVLTPAAYAQRSGWSDPLELSPLRPPPGVEAESQRRYGSSWFPDIAADPRGNLYVTWYSGIALQASEGRSLDLLMYREQIDGKWSEPLEALAPATGGLTVRNSLVVARDGRLHAIYRSNTAIVHASIPLGAAASSDWSQPKQISGFGAAYYVALTADSKGVLHAVYSEASDDPANPSPNCPNCSDLFYRRSLDGGETWSPPRNLSQTTYGENRPHIKVDQFDRVHVAWDEGIDWYAGAGQPRVGVYVRSDDAGQTWTERTEFRIPAAAVNAIRRQQATIPTERTQPGRATPGATTERPTPPTHLDAAIQTTLGLDGRGNPLIVFRGAHYNRIYSQYSADGGDTWGPPAELVGLIARPSDLDIYSMATDGAGNVHLVLGAFLPTDQPDDPTSPPTLWHLTWANGRWGGREQIMRGELYPEYPKIVVTGGNKLHVVWFTRSREDLFDSARANYRVWYSTRAIGAPAASALPFFTPAPVPTQPAAEATPTPAPAPTALPATIADAPLALGQPAWEGPALATIALALLAVLLPLGGALLFRLWINRQR